jgi:hypothetical protein
MYIWTQEHIALHEEEIFTSLFNSKAKNVQSETKQNEMNEKTWNQVIVQQFAV